MVFNLFVFLFGLFVGSFLNCVIYRLALPNPALSSERAGLGGREKKESFLRGRSFCPKCRHKLNWYDLMPIFSFLALGGKCRYCKEKISWQYPLVEIFTGLIFLLIFNFSSFAKATEGQAIFNPYLILNTLYLLLISCFLIIIFVYDLKHYIIPDKVLFPAIGIALFYRFIENFINCGLIENWSLKIENFAPLGNYFFTAITAAGFFLTIFLLSAGRWLGFGDVKLVFLMGLILGFPNILVALFLAFFFGAIIGIGLIIFGKKKLKSEIPFGPFLITGTFIAMLWGEVLVRWYLGLIL